MYKKGISAKVRTLLCIVVSYVKLRDVKQRGMFDLTPLGKRHLGRSGSRLSLPHRANHTLNVPVASRTLTSKTFSSIYCSFVEYPTD